jgi:hypothetical protein
VFRRGWILGNALAGVMAVALSAAAALAASDSGDTAAKAPPAASIQPSDDQNGTRPKGAQVLPLPAPDASTSRAQERGNAAPRGDRDPRAGGPGVGNERTDQR